MSLITEVFPIVAGALVFLVLGSFLSSSGGNKVITLSGSRTFTRHVFEDSQYKFSIALSTELEDVCKTYDIINIQYSTNEKGFSALIIMK